MKITNYILLFFMGLYFAPIYSYAQEEDLKIEESSEVFLEDYSDEFQENFFEALKQKGIENYDKAINLLLECRRLDPDNDVVDYELAKAYMSHKQYIVAQEYGIEALLAQPENPWYLNTLMEILQKQGVSITAISSKIPIENDKLKENIALFYFKQQNYDEALKSLKAIKTSDFTTDLLAKINDSIKAKEQRDNIVATVKPNEAVSNPLEAYKIEMEALIKNNNISELEKRSESALELYPSQPYFYFANGYALNKGAKHEKAIEVLESALDYMFDDVLLANKIYEELVTAYKAINNTSKANMYLRMIKPGF